ncbi:hypothetical protein A2X44_02735 [candidate division CPR3 bacterium GWF2_35_18]|uniref:Baseplate protein J-like domain-containing protein n=1 Tax=candidate division CPR3 bacterium GW2011_GWF2_35_18 TaxID=1618350 RepID=A0A0G0BZJ2_UNCC3|nr:MAG: hypothetical protein UR67_C0008G0037 [candidate division CPR3 bacterium GW2011_GWF2_35_18]OGB62507.1 MAG: hypothetical protein A2X44_02735 [candidate division CPR3 bacterium GWF2_35_18]OGB65551.1 MAG: hypothetical protein A2250_04315 [candidate division CPR3 bacterium RIFOXYA2_FULL_35_13]OGB76897.1 MAG: hypothetical protein A2476_03680 [candidate division CPR3 bacterium RIFOXYC2_FULL_35_7]
MLIYLEKQESLYDILKKIKASTEEGLELVVPEYAYLSKNSLNFKIIKEATLSYKKKLHIVTTDKIVEKLAKKDGIRVSEKPLSKEKVHWENYSDTEAEKIAEATESEKNKEIVEAKSEEIISPQVADQGLIINRTEKMAEDDDEDEIEVLENVVDVDQKTPEEKFGKGGKNKNYKKAKSFGKIAAIFMLICLIFLGGLAAVVYFVLPKATVEIILAGKDISAEAKITVDAGAIDVNKETKVIPGSVISVEETGQKTISATGRKEIGEKGSGTVTVQNFELEDTLFASGTSFTVYTGEVGAGLIFTATTAFTVPEGTETIEDNDGSPQKIITPGTVNVSVVAADIGSKYNLAADTNFTVGQEAYTSFRGINNDAFAGGSSQEVSIVADADHANLFTQLTNELYTKAATDLQSKLVGDQKLIQKSISNKVISQVYDQGVSAETDKVTLTLKTESRVTFYSESQLKQVVKDAVQAKAPEGYFVTDKDLIVSSEFLKAEDNGNLTFNAKARTTIYPTIDEAQLRQSLRGITPAEAEAYLKGMDKVLGYNISVWPPLPDFIRRMPFIDTRLEIKTTIQGE